MSKFEEISSNSSGMTITAGNSSSCESSEDIGDIFRARFEALTSHNSSRSNNANGRPRLHQYQQQHQLNGSDISVPPPKPVVTSPSSNHSHGHGRTTSYWNSYTNSNSSGISVPAPETSASAFSSNGKESSSPQSNSNSINDCQSPRKQFKLLMSNVCKSPTPSNPPQETATPTPTPVSTRSSTRSGFGNFITRSNMTTAASVIKDVWQENMYEEFVEIRKLVHKYNYIAMDTEFPGVVIWLDEDFRNSGENQFDMIRTNVDALKLIQLGISFMDENGTPPPGVSTWQFNFRFDLKTDRNAQDSIELLKDSGLQFDRHQSEGIDPDDFCELFICSGLVLNPDVFWITYHGGYDFGYLMRMLLGRNLPTDGDEFSQTMQVFFPCCYDVKVMLSECGNIRGGLQDVSLQLGVKRIGTQHQAGSDSLLTGMTFFQIKQRYFSNSIEEKKYNGKIFGLSLSLPEPGDSTG